MPETVANFDTPVRDRFGEPYTAKACGRRRSDGLWEGWIEFEHRATGNVSRSQRETTQSELEDLRYWASGLTPVYLEGALDRIVNLAPRRQERPMAPPAFDGPAPVRAGSTPVSGGAGAGRARGD
jgi:hypothetical protein